MTASNYFEQREERAAREERYEAELNEADAAYDDREDDEPNDCPECGRSFGPHYTGPCEHGGVS